MYLPLLYPLNPFLCEIFFQYEWMIMATMSTAVRTLQIAFTIKRLKVSRQNSKSKNIWRFQNVYLQARAYLHTYLVRICYKQVDISQRDNVHPSQVERQKCYLFSNLVLGEQRLVRLLKKYTNIRNYNNNNTRNVWVTYYFAVNRYFRLIIELDFTLTNDIIFKILCAIFNCNKFVIFKIRHSMCEQLRFHN